ADVPDSNLLIQNDAVYHLVNTSFSFEQAQRYCRGQSSGLTTSGVKEDEEGARQLLSTSNLKGPVWFETNKKQRLSFTSKDGYARVKASFPPLSAVSVCVRLQWDPRHESVSTVFSYAAPVFLNEFQLRGQIDEPKRNQDRKVHLALLIQGQHHHKAELPVDEDWHHVCVTWRSSDGFWAIYVDGKKGDSGKGNAQGNAKDIHGDGIFILGQDQDSFGVTLTEPFFGNLTDLNVWGEALEFQDVKELNTCSQLTNHRALFRWQDWSLTVHQSVLNVSATLTCPGYSIIYPSICQNIRRSYKTSILHIDFCYHLTCILSCFSQTADDVLSDTVDGQSWASVSRLLNVSEQVVLKEQKQLEDRDMLSLMHVLSRAADLPSTDNHSRRDAESLSQSFITIADSLISQDNASKWNSIKEVTEVIYSLTVLPDRGGWSTKGCTFISSLNNSTSCSCNHTTNFALLLQISEVQRNEDETGLQIFSLIGCGVSLCSLIFTFILFVAVGVPKSDRTTVHKNLIVALAVAQLLLIFSDWASGNQEVCWLVTVLLHLFFLSSFCWMLVEGLMLWSKVVSVNISEERRMKLYYVLGWGLPVVIVAVTLASTLDRYKAQQHCWLNLQSHVIWAFAGPVLFVLAVNGVVLFRVVMVTVASARRRAKRFNSVFVCTCRAATRPVLILLPVLGLTWLCGVLVHLSVVVAYVFITLSAFQVTLSTSTMAGRLFTFYFRLRFWLPVLHVALFYCLFLPPMSINSLPDLVNVDLLCASGKKIKEAEDR
uniref:Adhesion G protein-coupled receptor D2 n=1 Tax=Sinocyclocheilus grahami TaxID=75366 RepID=A0A672SHX8_SINGR